MSYVEMGPVTGGLVDLVNSHRGASKAKPLFRRLTPSRIGTFTDAAPVKTVAINTTEADELAELRGLRQAILQQ